MQPMDILIIVHKTLRVVGYRLLAVAELGVAVSSVIHTLRCFSCELHLLCVAVDGILEALDLSENQPHVGVDDRVLWIEVERDTEVFNRFLEPRNIRKATSLIYCPIFLKQHARLWTYTGFFGSRVIACEKSWRAWSYCCILS